MSAPRNETAARELNRAERQFAESGKAAPAARDADRATDTKEGGSCVRRTTATGATAETQP